MKQSVYRILTTIVALQLCFFAHAQRIITVAGDTVAGHLGDSGPATAAELNQPMVLARDGSGNMYIGEGNGNVIRKVNAAGTITTIAGTGVAGYSGDGGPATAATFSGISGIAFDPSGNLVIADFANHCIRKITTSTGIVKTIAGTGGISGSTGDGGPATAALFNHPISVRIDATGNIYVSDWSNSKIRKISTFGIVSTVVGTGTSGYSGDGTPATSAAISFPYRSAFDASGNLFFADGSNNCVRKVDITTGIITTVVGTSSPGFTGDGGPATAALLSLPTGVTFDALGNMYIADRGNGRVRKVDTSSMINTVAGSGIDAETGDGGLATDAALNEPFDVMTDANMNLFIVDINGNAVREVVALPVAAFSIPTASCEDSCLILTSAGRGTLDSVNWSVPGVTIAKPDSVVSGVCIPTAGTYNVVLYVHNISGSDTQVLSIVVNPTPHPLITYTGATLSVPAIYSSYKWLYMPGGVVPGAVSNTFSPTSLGAYYAEVVALGCPGYSTDTVLYWEGVPNIGQKGNKCWISPSGYDGVTLHSQQPVDQALVVTVYDVAGRQVFADNWEKGSSEKQLNVSGLAKGLYFIKLVNENTSAVLKWVR